MVFTASALSFMLVNLPKPVILTGSQKPISDILSDARANLLFAVHMATLDIPEVCIYFDHQLYRGNRTKKISSTHFSAFSSPNFPPLVTTGVEMEIRSDLIRRPGGLFQVLDSFDDRVISISLFPGMNVEILRHVLEFDIRGIVIQAFGTGTVPNEGKSIIPFIKEASASGKIVVVASQALQGQVNLDLYETARAAKNVGAISGKDMTIETSIIKLMFLQGLSDDIEEVKANFTRNLAGEISD
jgi:L-asparaginase